MGKLPQIKVSFFFVGDEFSLGDITNEIQIVPTKTREKDSFPIKELAKTFWIIETDKESCKVVSWQFEKLIKILIGKEKIINQICSKYRIKTEFCVTIWMENGDKPEMVLTSEIISFLACINAEVGFDLYID